MSGDQWVLRPHGALRQLEDNLWVVDGVVQMPPGPLPRRMTIVRLKTGDLVIFSAVALGEAEMAELEALGKPAFLVVPNGMHRLDVGGWKQRYPDMVVIAPAGARQAVEEVVPVNDTSGNFPDQAIQFIAVPGTQARESALLVTSGNRVTLVINDLIGNVQDARGIMKLVLMAMGFGGSKPQVPRAFRAKVIEDARAVAGVFRHWAEIPNLCRIVISHGSIIDTDVAGVLTRLADRLSR